MNFGKAIKIANNDFHLTLFKGNIFKELVKALFEKSRYLAIPYGYENPFPNIKNKLNKNILESSPTALRIRHSPDLLIYDDEKEDLKLVEVKMSSYETPQIKRIEFYKKYWEEAFVVEVVPFGNVFYAQQIAKLGIKGYYHLASDFVPIHEIFPKIVPNEITEYRNIALKMIQAFKNQAKDDTPHTQE
jgi:hypothetical protein